MEEQRETESERECIVCVCECVGEIGGLGFCSDSGKATGRDS